MYLMFAFFTVVIISGFALSAKGFTNLELQYNLDTCQLDQISEAKSGPVEVSGRVEPADNLMEAPLSGVDCVYFLLKVEEKHEQGDGPLWQVSSAARNGVPFYLRDDSGRILVDPDGLSVDLSEEKEFEVPGGVVPSDPIRSTGESLRQSQPEWIKDLDLNLFLTQTDRDTRFVESFLEPGESCYVFGSVMERARGRNLYYDDQDTPLLYRDGSTPAFTLSDESQAEEILGTIRVYPWMISGMVLILAGMIGAAGVLA